ncbi:MAG: histone deacetylase [Desulfovibrio sp.]|nr:histone deacetylase [Desulfovibrio sp.]
MSSPLVASRNLGVVFFPAFDWAITPTHPERQERLLYTRDQLEEEGLFDINGVKEYRPVFARPEQLERAHFLLPDAKSVASESHLAAAGGALTAARLVMEKKEDRAFALVRPPGHHAMRVSNGNRGFCNINNEAVMIEYIRDNYPRPDGRPLRIAIVDTDVHHGDGTQDIFWNDPYTLFISLHQDGRTLYPGTGFLNECGGPAALGRNLNIPMPPETSDNGYLFCIRNAVLPILENFKPDIIINSAGQDNHFTDPLANMRLTARGYARLNALLNPDIAVLEGGYSIRGALPYVNLAICLALAGIDAWEEIREPGWTESATRENPRIGEYLGKLCAQVVDLYFNPPAKPLDGYREGDLHSRDKRIFYDTDMLEERQKESWKICDHCAGLHKIETRSNRVPQSLCLAIPRGACENCRREAKKLEREAKKAAKYANIKVIDGDNIIPDSMNGITDFNYAGE